MKERKKELLNGLLFAAILLATIYGVFRGQDLGRLREVLGQCRPGWVAGAAGCVVLYLAADAFNLWLLLDSFGMGLGQGTCLLTSAVGFFFCAITPSATGGQPMQVYFLRRKGIPVSVTSVALLVSAVAFKIALLLLCLGFALFRWRVLTECLDGMMFLFYIGLGITGGWTAFLILLLFRPGLAKSILVWGMTVLEELHILKDRQKHQTAIEIAMETYGDTAAHVKGHPLLMGSVLAAAAVRRAAAFSVTWCAYKALGLTGTSWLQILALQATICICADMLPLPGGMGISEALFLRVFAGAFGALAMPGMILSRGIGHYCQLILCAVLTLAAAAVMRREPPLGSQ